MLHPLNDSADSPVADSEASAGSPHRVVDNFEQYPGAATLPLHEEKPASPICAACWAY